jgi:hypothetical protein
MPRGPRGEKRPADVIGAAVMVAKIATGEIEDVKGAPNRARGGRVGGKRRAEKLTPEERRAIARKAAADRWKNK